MDIKCPNKFVQVVVSVSKLNFTNHFMHVEDLDNQFCFGFFCWFQAEVVKEMASIAEEAKAELRSLFKFNVHLKLRVLVKK